MKKKILIGDYMYNLVPKVPKNIWQKLEKKYDVVYHSHKRPLTKEQILKYAKDCIGIVAGIELYNAAVLKALPKLVCLSRTGAGIDNIDLKEAAKRKITICNCPETVTEAVAELSIALILSLLRNIPVANYQTHKGKWNQLHGNLLQGKTVGIIGMGRVGKRVALLLKPFGCEVIGNDIEPDNDWSLENKVPFVSKGELYKRSDIICLHPSYLPQNKYLINEDPFKDMKKGVLLLNLSRGSIVKESALITNLKNGRVRGVAIDVYETEPYLRGQLTKFENVIMTPHIGGCTHESRYLMQTKALENLEKILATFSLHQFPPFQKCGNLSLHHKQIF